MTRSTSWSALLALLWAAASLGQENAPPPAPEAPPPAAQPPSPATTEPEEKSEAPPAGERQEVEDDEFVPTEELAPDAAVTFPVDI